jgi:ABC-type multidrug transport system fused ATPase/permease subunit
MGLVEFLQENFFTIIGIVISAIIAYVLGILTVYQITQKKLQYKMDSRNLISEKISLTPDLKILFKDRDVKNFTSTNIKITNNGFNPLKQDDFSSNEPLQIVTKNNKEILFANITDSSDKANGFEIVKQDVHSVIIGFNHINRNEWVSISIFHTGLSDEDIEIKGKIIGGNHPKKEPKWREDIGRILLISGITWLITAVIIYLALPFLSSLLSTTIGGVIFIIASLILFIIILTIIVFIIVTKTYQLTISRITEKKSEKLK